MSKEHDFSQPQLEIIRFCEALRDQAKRDRSWTKYKGSSTTCIVMDFLRKHLSQDLKLVGTNVFIKDRPTEFDLMIVNSKAVPVEHTQAYRGSDVLLIIEVKMNGFYHGDKVREHFEPFEGAGKPYLYLTVQESPVMCRISTSVLGRERFFCLRGGARNVEGE